MRNIEENRGFQSTTVCESALAGINLNKTYKAHRAPAYNEINQREILNLK